MADEDIVLPADSGRASDRVKPDRTDQNRADILLLVEPNGSTVMKAEAWYLLCLGSNTSTSVFYGCSVQSLPSLRQLRLGEAS